MRSQLAFFLSGILACLILFSGCDLINPDEELPFYVKINQPRVKVDENSSFLSPLGIQDVWMERGADFLGAYRAPAVIPVYPGDQDAFILGGGVVNSGLSAFRNRYPFWKAVEVDLNAAPMDTVEVSPVFEYFPEDSILIYPFRESFEGASIDLELDPTLGANILLDRSLDAFQGIRAGLAEFNSQDTLLEVVSRGTFRLPQTGDNNIWIEITFKNDIPFSVGLQYALLGFGDIGSLGGDILFDSKGVWTTVYLGVNDAVRGLPATADFRLFIRANGRGLSGKILLDNIRIVHFK